MDGENEIGRGMGMIMDMNESDVREKDNLGDLGPMEGLRREWWKEASVYQIYVRSFKDSNGDGIGDINGIIEKIPYLEFLGVDAVYLNPVNKSPNDDNGYDVSDYYDIMEEFGTLEDFKTLIGELHRRGIRLIMDLVINHTSDEHPWFQEARRSRTNPYHDFYIWHSGNGGQPPNNWTSFFGGSAWEYNVGTDEYYLHIFSKKQPDLNWENARLREAVYNIIHYWKNLRVDGFRFDAINHLAKDPALMDAGRLSDGSLDMLPRIQNLPPVHDHIRSIRENALNDPSVVVIGEAGGIGFETAKAYTSLLDRKLDMLFHFDMHSVGRGEKPWLRTDVNFPEIKRKFSGWAGRDPEEGWNPVFYSNHDTTRTLSRLGSADFPKASAKLLALLQMTMRGTPFIYYGDEIGMTNPGDFTLEDYRDVAVKNEYELMVTGGLVSHEDFIRGLAFTNRDNSRTPMQWENSLYSGFSEVPPWIRLNSDKATTNVAAQIKDDRSVLNFYRQAIACRKANPVLIYGNFREYHKDLATIYVYERCNAQAYGIEDPARYLVILNYSPAPANLPLSPELEGFLRDGTLLLSNYETLPPVSSTIHLSPYEACLIKLEAEAGNRRRR